VDQNNSKSKKVGDLKKLLSGTKPIVLEVRTEYCVNSKLTDVIIQKIEKEYNEDIRIARIDIETHRELLPRIKLNGCPSILLMKGNKAIKKSRGKLTRSNLKSLVEEIIDFD
jgi:thioredoxin-like negative regulator of GroEL